MIQQHAYLLTHLLILVSNLLIYLQQAIKDITYYNKIGGQDRYIEDNKLQWNENDRLGLRFDLKSGVCSVFLNSKELGNLADTLPDEFYLGASAYYANSVYETTLFEVS